jgi:hypothetical protein
MNEPFEETMRLFNACVEGRRDLDALFLTVSTGTQNTVKKFQKKKKQSTEKG